jgi:hypothetical protein
LITNQSIQSPLKLPTNCNIRLGWKGLPGTIPLAYSKTFVK